MNNIVVEIVSQTASFRDPGFQNFHKSLELPPPTTVVGMAGAALGLSALKAQEYFEDNNIRIGVYGFYRGKCSDTWKYSKRTKEMWLYKTELDGSIIQREFLIYGKFFLSFLAESMVIDKLFNAFHHPIYALTLGNSDSLAKIINIEKDLSETESNEIEHAIIEGNVINDVLRLGSEKFEFSIYHTSEPIAYDLPVAFQYEHDYGKRKVARIKTFSFIGNKMKLNYSIKGLKYSGIFIPTIGLQ